MVAARQVKRKVMAGVLALAVAACETQPETAIDTSGADTAAAPAAESYSLISSITGFSTPEAARYDGEQDVWFVSNIEGAPAARDNNGFISRLRPDGTIDSLRFIAGGRDGVTLNAPKGLLVVGDTLWVADLDVARAFNTRTGAAIGAVTVRGATMLNDLARGPDGAVYVTDTGLEFGVEGAQQQPSRIYRIGDMQASQALEHESLRGPNGIAWDGNRSAFLIGSYLGDSVFTWSAGDTVPRGVVGGPGQWDGLATLPDGRVLMSSWADSSIYVLDGSSASKVISGVAAPAAIGVDPQRMQVAIPSLTGNTVELYRIPPR